MRDAKERGDTCYDRSYATNFIERRVEVRQELKSVHFQRPIFCLVGGAAESGILGTRGVVGWREQKLIFMCVSSCAMSGRLALRGACMLFLLAERCLKVGGASSFDRWV